MTHQSPPPNARGDNPRSFRLALAVLLVSASGANCPHFLHDEAYGPPAARGLPDAASLNDVVARVNENTGRLQSLYTTDATLSVPGAPKLSAQMALQRPRRFRLRAETRLTGAELDLGSNEELFWFWVKRNTPPAVFFCRHDQFQSSAARTLLPVEPDWLIEALGIVWLDPAAEHRGPFPVGRGRLRIESPVEMHQAQWTRITVVDEVHGWVLEQHLVDEQNRLVASALASQHQSDPVTQVTLPSRVEIHWPAARFTMRIELRNVLVNQVPRNGQLWALPSYGGYDFVDLADPRWQASAQQPADQEPRVQEELRPDEPWRGQSRARY